MYNKLFCIVTTLALMTGCTTDELADMNEQSGGPGINFGVTATSADRLSRGGLTSPYQSLTLKSAETADTLAVTVETADYFIEEKHISRGTPIDGVDNLGDFQVYAYYYANESTTTPSLFFEENVSKRDADTWATGTTYYWPTSGELAFFGMSPAVNDDFLWFDRYQIPTGENDAVISYIAPTEPEQQPDIVVASTDRMNNSESGEKVPMAFRHILSQVKFRVGAEMQAGTINSITLTNVVKHGYYHHAADGGAWSLDEAGEDQTCDYMVVLDEAVTEGSNGIALGAIEETLMMLPQTLGANCELVVKFTPAGSTEARELRASLAGGVWTMGGTTVYNINIEPEYTLKFVEDEIAPLDAHYEKFVVNINSDKLENGWTLTSNYPENVFFTTTQSEMQSQGYWIDNKKGTNSIDGTGNQTVYVYVTENIGDADRDIELQLTPKGVNNASTVAKNVTQYCPNWTSDGGIGVERIFDTGSYPWGFKFEVQKVTYDAITNLGAVLYRGWVEYIWPLLEISKPSFVTYGTGRTVCEFDFSSINFDDAQSLTDGESNTLNMYSYDGISSISQIDRSFNRLPTVTKHIVPENASPDNIENYAAYMVLKKCNKFDELGEDIKVAILCQDVNLWYLPASGQYEIVNNTVGLNGIYWTSTCRPSDYNSAYIFGNPSDDIDARDQNHKIVAVRNRNN